MARTGPQKYPGASCSYWHQDRYGGSAMETNVIVWHTTEGVSVPSYGGGRSAPTFTVLPDIDRTRLTWYQHFDFDVSSRALVNRAGGVETNTLNAGQVELVGTCDPRHRKTWDGKRAGVDYLYWPDAPDWALAELARFVRWVHDEHGVRMESTVDWTPYPESYGGGSYRLSGSQWRRYYGHLGHQHVPENDHGDPGDLDMARVLDHARGTATTPKEDDMPQLVNVGETDWKTLQPGDWDAIEFHDEWADERDDHWDKGGSQFVRGACRFTGTLHLRFDGLPVGEQVQVRLARVNDRGEYVHHYPIHEVHGTTGDAFASVPVTGHLDDGNGMRVQLYHWQDAPIRFKTYVEALVWEGN